MSTTILGKELKLWPNGAPGAQGTAEADTPTVTVFLPSATTATGAAVVICPGGGYGNLAMDHEGRQIAEFLNAMGVAAFICKYRVAPYRHPLPLQDAQRAVRTVRANAENWGVDPQRIAIWGFSAGGHLVSTAATRFDEGNPTADDPLDRVSSRPDLLILGYPVVTFKAPYAHMGSRQNLIGDDALPPLVASLSNDAKVTAGTPPTFLFHTTNDPVVPVENSILFFLALRRAGVPAEMHIYENGPHGVGLAPTDPILCSWSERLTVWLGAHGWLTAPSAQ